VTLLEALVALLILGLSAVGYLDVFQGGASAVAVADDWTQTVAVADAVLEAATLGDAVQAQSAVQGIDSRYAHTAEARPHASGLVDLVVTVTSPRGTRFTVHRLMRRPATSPGGIP
jgi:type II secretory pathway pseudopilin PulG